MKIIIRIDQTGNHNHTVEQVKKFPEEHEGIICCNSKESAEFYLCMLERSYVPADIQKKYRDLKKIVADFS